MHDFCHGNDKIRDSRSIPVQQTGWRTAWNQTLLRPQVLRLSRTELGMVQGKFLYFQWISLMGFNRCHMILWKPWDTTTIFRCFHKEADSKHVCKLHRRSNRWSSSGWGDILVACRPGIIVINVWSQHGWVKAAITIWSTRPAILGQYSSVACTETQQQDL